MLSSNKEAPGDKTILRVKGVKSDTKMGAPPAKEPLVNRNLISLKIVLFLFYAGKW